MSEKPTIPEVIDRFAAYHRREPAWGSLHVVLDDGNVADEFVRGCIEHAEGMGDAEGAELARILLSMSKTQRARLPRLVAERYRWGGERVSIPVVLDQRPRSNPIEQAAPPTWTAGLITWPHPVPLCL